MNEIVEDFETLSEEEKEERKKQKQREQLLRQMINSGAKVVKNVNKVCAVPLKIFFKDFENDKGIVAFLDASGLKKKPNYEKEIAENTTSIAKSLQEKNRSF